MADEPSGGKKPRRKRRARSLATGSRALVIRDRDAMRKGVKGVVREVKMTRVVLGMSIPLESGEQINLRLRNSIQRFKKEARGVVRRVMPLEPVPPDEETLFRVDVELYTRLTPLEVSLLRMGIRDDSADSEPKWV